MKKNIVKLWGFTNRKTNSHTNIYETQIKNSIPKKPKIYSSELKNNNNEHLFEKIDTFKLHEISKDFIDIFQYFAHMKLKLNQQK